MVYYVCFLAFGDNLISLSLLEQLDQKINILGTNYTKNISLLMNNPDQFSIKIVFNDIPSFYDMRKKGLIQAIKDMYKFLNYIKENNITEMIFEKKDFRSILISILTHSKIHYPNSSNRNIYENRKHIIENIYKKQVTLNRYTLKIRKNKTIVINPLTRMKQKNIEHEHLKYIIDVINKNNYKIYLIDIEKKYEIFSSKVQHYLTNTTLDDIKNLILECDLYIGGDSFLIHLAYYLKRNYFMILYTNNDDFSPPNIEDVFYIKAHHCNNFNKEINQKFFEIGLIV
ncbi:glycosyltransferase family 9 protein [Sulfurospirillum sp. UCH001]|uniref:glycosyltransferase family 9 protein n=1 Tax=Sulfurospirillum sp. UCH001 TaxID=1581011 RepID=UPI00082E8486|nr:glycosyltransferase family 9 protein [Sulfurospirillum sp. UCH001]